MLDNIIIGLIGLTAMIMIVLYFLYMTFFLKKPKSGSEKDKSYRENGYIEHWMYVWELQKLLKHLKSDDWITPNEVHNLAVGRDKNSTIAAINFHFNSIEFFNGEEDFAPFYKEI